MVRRKKKSKGNYKFIFYIFMGFFIALGMFFGLYGDKILIVNPEIEIIEDIIIEEGVAYVSVPAIGPDGSGVSTKLIVKAEKGTGKTLVDINGLLFWVDTQNSIRMAKKVAEEVTGLNTNNYDMTFSINANASLIGGESAGAALAMASLAALLGDKLKEDVMITGTINHDGTIGPIGGVLEKARAAKEGNINLFLVPLLQGTEVIYGEIEHCEKFGLMDWCSIERIPKKIDIKSESGIEIIEVGSIVEAYSYFVDKEEDF